MNDWISLHYSGKSGVIFTEFKEAGKFLERSIGAIFIEKIETPIGSYYKYKVSDLSAAYYALYAIWERIY